MAIALLVTLSLLCFMTSRANKEIVYLCSNGTTANYDSYTTSESKNCGCENKVCLQKCCQNGFYHYHHEGYSPVSESICIKHNSTPFTVPIYEGMEKKYDWNDSFVVGMLKCGNAKRQYYKVNKSNKLYIQENGSLYYPNSKHKIFNRDRFCVDEEDGFTVYLCYSDEEEVTTLDKVYLGQSIGMVIALPFLLLTFLVYAIIPEASLHNKALMNYVISQFIGYLFIAIAELYPGQMDVNFFCPALGYTIIFFLLMSFFWLNVMSLDVWFAFSNMLDPNKRKFTERKTFLMYVAYAAGISLLDVLIIFLLNKFGDRGSIYFPAVGYERCFLRGGYPSLFFFYGPVTILIIANYALYALTAIKIQKIQRETSILTRSDNTRHFYEDEKQKFNVFVKLLFAMGIHGTINGTIDTVSWAIEWQTSTLPLYVWYLIDSCNAMYGMFIFFIFVFNKKIWQSLKKKMGSDTSLDRHMP